MTPALSLPEAPHPLVEWVAGLPAYEIKRDEFFALPEYSCSIPTGTRVGKIWRANLMAYNPTARPVQMALDHGRRVVRYRHPDLWVVKAYAVCDDPNHPRHDEYVKAGGCLAIPCFRPVFL